VRSGESLLIATSSASLCLSNRPSSSIRASTASATGARYRSAMSWGLEATATSVKPATTNPCCPDGRSRCRAKGHMVYGPGAEDAPTPPSPTPSDWLPMNLPMGIPGKGAKLEARDAVTATAAQSVHAWLAWYEAGGLDGLGSRRCRQNGSARVHRRNIVTDHYTGREFSGLVQAESAALCGSRSGYELN
jgi:hypothetical protein